jgi:hypothetical protein
MGTSALSRPDQRTRDSRTTEKRNLSALLALLALLAAGAPALAANSIEELLQLDDASSQNDELRPDLNVLTEAQWEYYFKLGRKQTDTALDSQLIERESEKRTSVLYIWIATIAAGFGMAIGTIKAWPFVRHVVKTLTAPVQMKNPSLTISGYAWY